jgi:hypothetical protein
MINEITLRADTLLDEISRFHFLLKTGKPTGNTLDAIRSVCSKAKRIESLIEKELAGRGYHD